ncbi:MAG: caspase family protein [Anaerolineae bacterium]
MLVRPDQGGFAPDNVTLLLDGAATGFALRQALARLAQRCDAESSALIYLSCHGARIAHGPLAGEYLLPVDVDGSSPQALAASAISGAEFSAALHAIPARKVVVIFDCCHAGGIGQPKDALVPALQAGLPERYYQALLAGRGRVILASSRSDEYSYTLPGAANSVFTTHLLAGLRGDIASDDGLIRIFDLFEYVQPARHRDAHPHQHPVFKAELEENFPVALRLGGQVKAIARTSDGYQYDAYLLYAEKSEHDAHWVASQLIPQLEAAGLRVAISADVLQAGVARVATIQRGHAAGATHGSGPVQCLPGGLQSCVRGAAGPDHRHRPGESLAGAASADRAYRPKPASLHADQRHGRADRPGQAAAPGLRYPAPHPQPASAAAAYRPHGQVTNPWHG